MTIRSRVRRLVVMFIMSLMLACVPGVVVRLMAQEGGCHPFACHAWGYFDWEYWYFGCDRPHCAECAMGN